MSLLTTQLFLTGCANLGFSAATPQTNPCKLIPLQSYPKDFTDSLADEIADAAPGAKFPEAIRGCTVTRDAVRACAAIP